LAEQTPATIVWFRKDLRLEDNPALHAALTGSSAAQGGEVIPVFIWSPEDEFTWSPGAASKWWLHHSLLALETELEKLGLKLIISRGEALTELLKLVTQTKASTILWNRRYEPQLIARDKRIKEELKKRGLETESFNSLLLKEPWEILSKTKTPYQVYTPFFKALLAEGPPAAALPRPKPFPGQRSLSLSSLTVEELKLLPEIDWAEGMREMWTPGEAGAQQQLRRFVHDVGEYDELRNRPDLGKTSRLSPHLHFGEISPRQIWHTVAEAFGDRLLFQNLKQCKGPEVYLKEIAWREFAYHLLYHFPHTAESPLRAEFANFPWQRDQRLLKRWQKGQTGYPIVDAGMRELWQTGWMHNRVRMIVASFLVKNLLVPWQAGAAWFWDTLVDADLASNTLGWQWTAGCGADAAPYFRIFNPILQGAKFDPRGDYVRRFVPELRSLEERYIHQPWEAPVLALRNAGITLGSNYPRPIVALPETRERALEAYAEMKRGR